MLECDGSGELFSDARGSGVGSGSTIFFTPGVGFSHEFTFIPTYGPGVQADEVLFHELVHALRSGHGMLDCGAARDRYDTVDDFVAILFTNIYSSERNRPLRMNHRTFSRLPKVRSTSAGYLAAYSVEIEELCTSFPQLTHRLSAVECPFNPIREYYSSRIRSMAGAAIDYLKQDQVIVIEIPFELQFAPPRRRRRGK